MCKWKLVFASKQVCEMKSSNSLLMFCSMWFLHVPYIHKICAFKFLIWLVNLPLHFYSNFVCLHIMVFIHAKGQSIPFFLRLLHTKQEQKKQEEEKRKIMNETKCEGFRSGAGIQLIQWRRSIA